VVCEGKAVMWSKILRSEAAALPYLTISIALKFIVRRLTTQNHSYYSVQKRQRTTVNVKGHTNFYCPKYHNKD